MPICITGALSWPDPSSWLERRPPKRDNFGSGLVGTWPACPQTSGGNDPRGRTRLAGAIGAPAGGAPRPRHRHRGAPGGAGIGPAPDPAAEKAQALSAGPYFLHRRSAHARHHRVTLPDGVTLLPPDMIA